MIPTLSLESQLKDGYYGNRSKVNSNWMQLTSFFHPSGGF